jgi:hypothetical protein
VAGFKTRVRFYQIAWTDGGKVTAAMMRLRIAKHTMILKYDSEFGGLAAVIVTT